MKKLFIILVPIFILAQETETIKKTEIYSSPKESKTVSIGQFYPGTKVTKLKKDKSGKFIKATIEFYIPIESLEEGRVSHLVGVEQIADNAKYKLLKATRDGNRIKISLQIKNAHAIKELDFSAMAFVKVIGKGENKGELNPFEGKYQGLAIIKPNASVTAELVYDFKSKPKNVELICTGKLNGDRVYYNLGF
ncbi:MAG: hypothetical protein QF847_04875 [Candidatus Marinimicrobia bacterium]|mgnify:FL=1|nr:hypothetical protein [Candidatus Neomarinimicrobiota bacterium]MDP6726565.1 hypothetical protein [Candidatus Neomarinimicrobiota bacterium]